MNFNVIYKFIIIFGIAYMATGCVSAEGSFEACLETAIELCPGGATVQVNGDSEFKLNVGVNGVVDVVSLDISGDVDHDISSTTTVSCSITDCH